MPAHIVMGLSGGMDSTTLLGAFLELGTKVHCVIFSYGSKHNAYENDAAVNVVKYYQDLGLPVTSSYVALEGVMAGFKSALLLTGEAIPEGHYAEESMRKTVVPGRNLIMAAVMAGLAESIGATQVALGVHSGDHHIYPDCRPGFVTAADEAIKASSDGRVSVVAPFLNDTKQTIIERGLTFDIDVPYHLTRTCYKNQPVSCGKCGSCRERLEAFELVGMEDPIPYE